jgi:hypothetical protein
VACQVDWAVNGSVEEGQKLGKDTAKLMLRAYNTEADNAVCAVKPHTSEAVKKRLDHDAGHRRQARGADAHHHLGRLPPVAAARDRPDRRLPLQGRNSARPTFGRATCR